MNESEHPLSHTYQIRNFDLKQTLHFTRTKTRSQPDSQHYIFDEMKIGTKLIFLSIWSDTMPSPLKIDVIQSWAILPNTTFLPLVPYPLPLHRTPPPPRHSLYHISDYASRTLCTKHYITSWSWLIDFVSQVLRIHPRANLREGEFNCLDGHSKGENRNYAVVHTCIIFTYFTEFLFNCSGRPFSISFELTKKFRVVFRSLVVTHTVTTGHNDKNRSTHIKTKM